jgi:hypothetical protein
VFSAEVGVEHGVLEHEVFGPIEVLPELLSQGPRGEVIEARHDLAFRLLEELLGDEPGVIPWEHVIELARRTKRMERAQEAREAVGDFGALEACQRLALRMAARQGSDRPRIREPLQATGALSERSVARPAGAVRSKCQKGHLAIQLFPLFRALGTAKDEAVVDTIDARAPAFPRKAVDSILSPGRSCSICRQSGTRALNTTAPAQCATRPRSASRSAFVQVARV